MLNQIQWVGHRGFPAKFPENSLSGIIAACKAGAAGVEFDVQLSQDGVPVVIHDANLERTAGALHHVNEHTAEQLSKIVIGEPARFGELFAKEYLPLLASVASALEEWPHVKVFVELKNESLAHSDAESYLQAVYRAIAPISNRAVIISYDLELLRCAQSHGLYPVGWVLSRYTNDTYQQIEQQSVDFVICNHKKLPELTQPLWAGAWQWFVYDVVDELTARQCYARGVKWLETWNIELAKKLNTEAFT